MLLLCSSSRGGEKGGVITRAQNHDSDVVISTQLDGAIIGRVVTCMCVVYGHNLVALLTSKAPVSGSKPT